MTVREYAVIYGISRSTVYRRIKAGKLTARKINRRWVIGPGPVGSAAPSMGAAVPTPPPEEWPSYVNREYAEADGRKPSDFRFLQWPVSNVTLSLREYGMAQPIALVYRCDIPADTPAPNRYDADDNPLPDPVGMALARVVFVMHNALTGAELDSDSRTDHVEGKVEGYVTQSPLWKRLTPGTSLRVGVTAHPLFFFLNEEGGGELGYANMGLRGYFGGSHVSSPVYTLSMDDDGNLSIGEQDG